MLGLRSEGQVRTGQALALIAHAPVPTRVQGRRVDQTQATRYCQPSTLVSAIGRRGPSSKPASQSVSHRVMSGQDKVFVAAQPCAPSEPPAFLNPPFSLISPRISPNQAVVLLPPCDSPGERCPACCLDVSKLRPRRRKCLTKPSLSFGVWGLSHVHSLSRMSPKIGPCLTKTWW